MTLVCIFMSLLLLIMFLEIVFICCHHADPNRFLHLLHTLLWETELFIFTSAREFSFPHFAFSLLSLHKILNFSTKGGIFYQGKDKIFSFLIENPLSSWEKVPSNPMLAFEFCISWLAGRQKHLIKQQFPD